jgi:putative NADH-flavin reductase
MDMKKVLKAKLALDICEKNACVKTFLDQQADKEEMQKRTMKMMLELLRGKITPEAYKKKFLALYDERIKRPEAREHVMCVLKNCNKELNTTVKALAKQVNMKVDANALKDIDAYVSFMREVVESAMNTVIERMKKK